ncbi:EthD family reductase [Zobellia uliginosa]|uniref:EthD family reductase n=1 Tax=Zobellia uliginosa TaxID=143224 RepID=UPI001C078597|nr:EthD family reductase [Zobellia uliginosa]MBU2945113.1 EthD family reductase [Zobellia uliginosa]
MIKVSVLYTNSETVEFNHEYYSNTHIPMVQSLVGSALKKVEVEKGLGGRVPGELAPFVTIANLYFDSLEEFQKSFGPHAEKFAADVPNYSNVDGIIQISELV